MRREERGRVKRDQRLREHSCSKDCYKGRDTTLTLRLGLLSDSLGLESGVEMWREERLERGWQGPGLIG